MQADLVEAARRGDVVALRAGIAAGADPDAPTTAGLTALEAACAAGQLAAARVLLQRGASRTDRVWQLLGSDPALAFVVETDDLRQPMPDWLAEAIAKQEAAAEAPYVIAATAEGPVPSRCEAVERLPLLVRAGAPWPPTLSALEAALDDTETEVAAAAARALDGLSREGADVPVGSLARALVHLAAPGEGRALLVEALSSARRRGEAAFEERVALLQKEPGNVEAAALALANDALRAEPVDWSLIDRLAGDRRAVVRRAVIDALGKALSEGGASEAAGRIAAGLIDANESVRAKSAVCLHEAWRGGRPVAIPDPLLVRLAGRLRDAGGHAIAEVLSRQVAVDRAVAARIVELLGPTAETADGPMGDLARLSRDVAEGRRATVCADCGTLGDKTTWGYLEAAGTELPEPPAFKRLRRAHALLENDVYRCPACGRYFEWTSREVGSYLDDTWDSCILTRYDPSAPELAVYEATRTGDFGPLATVLMEGSEDGRVRALETVGALVRDEGRDVSPLESALLALAGVGVAPKVRSAALFALAMETLRAQDIGRLGALLRSADAEERGAALGALGLPDNAAARACTVHLRDILRAIAEVPGWHGEVAARILSKAPLDPGTVTEATRDLDSDRPGLRATAALVLVAAAEQGLDVTASLPRLAALMDERPAGEAAFKAIRAARDHGADLTSILPELAAHVRTAQGSDREREIVELLRAMQMKGEDISAAFEALVEGAAGVLVALLREGLERGRDFAAALPLLRRLAAGPVGAGDEVGRAALEAVIRHLVRQRDWVALEALLRDPDPERGRVSRAILRRAVHSVDGSREAIVFLARVTARATPASRPPVKPSRTSWSKGNDHVEVNGRDVTAWTDGPFGGDGRSCMLEEFLAGDLHDTVSGIFGRGVLREVWAAARWFAAQKAGRTGGKRKRK